MPVLFSANWILSEWYAPMSTCCLARRSIYVTINLLYLWWRKLYPICFHKYSTEIGQNISIQHDIWNQQNHTQNLIYAYVDKRHILLLGWELKNYYQNDTNFIFFGCLIRHTHTIALFFAFFKNKETQSSEIKQRPCKWS